MAVAEKVGFDRRGNTRYKHRPDGEEIIEIQEETEHMRIGGRVVERTLRRPRKIVDDDLPVIHNLTRTAQGALNHPTADPHMLSLFLNLNNLLAIWPVFVARIPTPVKTYLLRHSHEDRILFAASETLGDHFCLGLLFEEQHTGQDVDVCLHYKDFDGKVHARQHPGMLQDPPPDVLSRRVA